MRRKKMAKPEAISDILSGMFKDHKVVKKIRQYNVFEIWEEVVGPNIAEQTTPQKVSGSTLTVMAKSSAWVQELSMMRFAILEKIKERLPDADIKDIRFVVAERKTIY